MGTLNVDQITSDARLVRDQDTRLSGSERERLVTDALRGSRATEIAGVRAVRWKHHVILSKQVTHLGFPWPEFKKRIQIPRTWIQAHNEALRQGLTPRFMGVYRYGSTTIFVDFDPSTYVLRKANNSAAHVATNDLFQAQVHGTFTRTDARHNRLTSIRCDLLPEYLETGQTALDRYIVTLDSFNREFVDGDRIEALHAVKQMHDAEWPDRFQGEWPGFYLEFRLDSFLRREGIEHVRFVKAKQRNSYDYDLEFLQGSGVGFLGDLKASDHKQPQSPGNDAGDIRRCVEQFGRFWYVIYEHSTRHARDNGDRATIEWNEWKRSVGYVKRTGFDPLSYAGRFKASVSFFRVKVLEVNSANFDTVLGDFTQGRQPSGEARALKVMIKKKYIDNFLVYTHDPGIGPEEASSRAILF